MGFNVNGVLDTDYTKQLCHFIKELKYEDIPPMVIDRAKMNVLHTIGVSLCSCDLKQAKDAIALAEEISGGSVGEATLWGSGKKVSWEAAAFAAGTMGDLLDWEDCSITGHPSAGVIPMAVITAEVLHKSGKDLLTAVVAGYEVYQRVAMSGGSNIVSYNIFGNLAVLCKLLDLSEEDMNKAFGVGTACAIAGASAHSTTMSDSLNYLYGYKTQNTVTMARTIIEGIEGMEDAFDCPSAYLNHLNAQRPEWFTKGLGEEWLMMTAILIKHWPANVFVQTYAELAGKLITKYKYNPDDIEEIIIRPSVEFRHWYSENGFTSVTHAEFAIPYATACCMYHPEPGAIWYQPETMQDPKIVALMNKVKADGFVDMKGSKVFIKDLIEGKHPEKFMIVRMKDGTEYVESTYTHRGHPYYMLTREEFADMFRVQTKYILSPEKIEGAIDCICHLDQYEDAAVLPSFLF